MRRLLASLVCFALFAACGDDGEVDPEADQELIEDALLTAHDLPPGFEEVDAEDDDDPNPCNEDVLGIDPDDLDDAETARAGPVEFESDLMNVTAEITAFDDDDLPQQVLEAIDDDEYLDCIAEEFAENLGEGGTFEAIESIDSPVEGGRAAEATFTFSADDGSELGVVSQQHAVLVDRYGISLQVTALAGDLDDDLVEDLLATMVERLES